MDLMEDFRSQKNSIPSSLIRDHPKVSKDFYIREIQKLVKKNQFTIDMGYSCSPAIQSD